ncbi:MAG: 4Fe-4S binding protein [Methanothermobacter wolfeii]|uniref:4Fe-4S binding protein n=1 Tax=Methanothermobacter wolfeii TaxID=145261 RepID=UPI0009FD4FCF|nr:4Fe-4S binding protein [Methanothermobacter wolfeii]
MTPECGPRQKISAIITSIANLPIKDKNEHAWIPEYCERCGECIKACPEKALVEIETCCEGEEVKYKKLHWLKSGLYLLYRGMYIR